MLDVQVHNEGTVFAFDLQTPRAQEWVETHVSEPMFLGDMLVVEHRYAYDVAQGMLNDGLAVG